MTTRRIVSFPGLLVSDLENALDDQQVLYEFADPQIRGAYFELVSMEGADVFHRKDEPLDEPWGYAYS